MAYRNLLVQVDDSRGCAGRIALAIDLAVARDAHLTGLHVLGGASPAAFAQGFPPELMADVQQQSRDPRPWPFAHGEEPGADIGLHLARHGVKVEVQRIEGRDIDVANALLSHLADQSADLLVMGAYGHSRLREFVLGGTTRTILAEMTVPMLMSH